MTLALAAKTAKHGPAVTGIAGWLALSGYPIQVSFSLGGTVPEGLLNRSGLRQLDLGQAGMAKGLLFAPEMTMRGRLCAICRYLPI